MTEMIYDIRTSEKALQTLINLTGVPISIWQNYIYREQEYEYIDDLVADVINSYGYWPKSYKDFEFICFHVTTSANRCESFRKYGILDLQESYTCNESELRLFLENHGIYIDLDESILTYQGKEFDISYDLYTSRRKEQYNCRAIGRKFYYDYTICGFLSVWERSPYGGQVHRRPEILMNIDNLLGLNLSQEWALTHSPYEIIAKVNGTEIVYDGDEDESDTEKVLHYLTKAYLAAFGDTTEVVLLMKNHVQIPTSDILQIKPLTHWKIAI